MHLDKNRNYSTIKSIEPGHPVCFMQDGIEYDRQGFPCDETQVQDHKNKVAAEAQAKADVAMAAAQKEQAAADATIEALDEPDPYAAPEPDTVPKLKAALDKAGIEYPKDALKLDLQELWDARATIPQEE